MEVGLLLALLLTVATAKKSDYRTVYACEGSRLNIVCPEEHIIRLVRANYGRFSISICNEHGSLDWSVDCTSHRSYYVIYDRCNHMSSCTVKAASDTFDDPCPGTYKYLEVQYQCLLAKLIRIPITAQPMTTTPNSSVVKSTIPKTMTSTMRPPIIIPITRSTKPTVATPTFKPSTVTEVLKLWTTMRTSKPTIVIPTTTISSKFDVVNKANVGKTQTTASVFSKEDHCSPIHSRNLTWEWTKAGTEVVQKCPGGTFGEARWLCGLNPVRWTPDIPDLSECSSLWVDNLRTRVDGGDSVVNIAAELSVMTHRKPLYGGDVRHATEILHRLVAKMADKMKEIADDKQRHQLLQELLESAGDVTSNLLDLSPSWGELTTSERRNLASTLLEALEHSGWLLASAHKSAFFFRKALHNIFLSVRVLEAWAVSDLTFPSAEEVDGTEWETIEDRIHLPMQALLGTASNGVVKVVFASYERVKDFLGTVASSRRGILHNSSHIINSRVISASTGRYPGVKFSEPVTVTFKLIQEENVTNPQCVYWDLDTRLWSREGCSLKRSNKTHAVCECDHLTNFALFMEIKPLITSNQNWLLLKVIIFTSCTLTSILFLLTELLLQIFRSFPNDHSMIHKHLCICLTLAEILYMGGVGLADLPCAILAGALHFTLQAVFVWFFLSAFQLYLLLVEPTHISRFRCYSIVAYGIPALIVTVSVLVDYKSYGTSEYCFLRFDNYYIFSFVGPAVSCIVGAFMFLSLTICRTCWSSPSTKNKEATKFNSISIRNREAWFVILSSGSTWAFLLLYMLQKAAILAYVFAALNCVQGLAVFIFFGLNNNEVQQAYHKWKAGGTCAQPKTTGSQYPPAANQQSVEAPYLQPSTTVSSLSTVTTPELEFQLGTFHHSDLCHATRSPIYENREQLVA